jgi:hypothetical protein
MNFYGRLNLISVLFVPISNAYGISKFVNANKIESGTTYIAKRIPIGLPWINQDDMELTRSVLFRRVISATHTTGTPQSMQVTTQQQNPDLSCSPQYRRATDDSLDDSRQSVGILHKRAASGMTKAFANIFKFMPKLVKGTGKSASRAASKAGPRLKSAARSAAKDEAQDPANRDKVTAFVAGAVAGAATGVVAEKAIDGVEGKIKPAEGEDKSSDGETKKQADVQADAQAPSDVADMPVEPGKLQSHNLITVENAEQNMNKNSTESGVAAAVVDSVPEQALPPSGRNEELIQAGGTDKLTSTVGVKYENPLALPFDRDSVRSPDQRNGKDVQEMNKDSTDAISTTVGGIVAGHGGKVEAKEATPVDVKNENSLDTPIHQNELPSDQLPILSTVRKR